MFFSNARTFTRVGIFLIFAGGMGDEDENQPENDLVWQKYFLRPLEASGLIS